MSSNQPWLAPMRERCVSVRRRLAPRAALAALRLPPRAGRTRGAFLALARLLPADGAAHRAAAKRRRARALTAPPGGRGARGSAGRTCSAAMRSGVVATVLGRRVRPLAALAAGEVDDLRGLLSSPSLGHSLGARGSSSRRRRRRCGRLRGWRSAGLPPWRSGWIRWTVILRVVAGHDHLDAVLPARCCRSRPWCGRRTAGR